MPVSQDGASLDQVLAAASTVQNRVPDGSTWDGKTDLPMDEGTFRQMMSEVWTRASCTCAEMTARSSASSAISLSWSCAVTLTAPLPYIVPPT